MVRPRYLIERLAAAAFAARITPAWAGPGALACQSAKSKAAGTLFTVTPTATHAVRAVRGGF